MAKSKNLPWTAMLKEVDVRTRIGDKNPDAIKLLDFFATRIPPFRTGGGWTIFNDWLDKCYTSKWAIEKRPADVPFVESSEIRRLVFPVPADNPRRCPLAYFV